VPRPRLEDAEARLLAAGLALVARYGVEGINSNKIARRAGLGVGTFYAHFPDKHALLRELRLRTVAGLRDARLAALGKAAPDPRAQVRASIEAAMRFAQRHPEAYRVTFGRERAASSRHGPVVSESTRPLVAALRRRQSRGGLPAEIDVEVAARAFGAMEVGTLLWWLDDAARPPAETVVDTLTRLHPLLLAASDSAGSTTA
jgi:AcrR family transcriptional regulator